MPLANSENPFSSPHSFKSSTKLMSSIVNVVGISFAMCTLIISYVAWFGAWRSLGHAPRVGYDDPFHINDELRILCRVLDWLVPFTLAVFFVLFIRQVIHAMLHRNWSSMVKFLLVWLALAYVASPPIYWYLD